MRVKKIAWQTISHERDVSFVAKLPRSRIAVGVHQMPPDGFTECLWYAQMWQWLAGADGGNSAIAVICEKRTENMLAFVMPFHITFPTHRRSLRKRHFYVLEA
jgi:hypothetical protein